MTAPSASAASQSGSADEAPAPDSVDQGVGRRGGRGETNEGVREETASVENVSSMVKRRMALFTHTCDSGHEQRRSVRDGRGWVLKKCEQRPADRGALLRECVWGRG